jgi:two-component system response regulator FixJ
MTAFIENAAPEPMPLPCAVPARGEIVIVDDDFSVREALAMAFRVEGYQVVTFESGENFLAVAHARNPRCVILDQCLAGKSGLDVLREIGAARYRAPIVLISGQADIPTAVAAIQTGAADVIEKPFDGATILARVGKVMEARGATGDAAHNAAHHVAHNVGLGLHEHAVPVAGPATRRNRLTPREREVLAQIAAGATNKEAGRTLRISPRTIEVHRARIMEKLGARTAADLVRIVLSDYATAQAACSALAP